MTASAPVGEAIASLAIRPPLQQRTREAWNRILNAGVALLVEGGYEALTIAAVCDRAKVAPRAVYDRVDDKDTLFLAVYEHGMDEIRADQAAFADDERWDGLHGAELARAVLRQIAAIFTRHGAFLRRVVLLSGVHDEIHRRGSHYSRKLGDDVTAVLLRERDRIDHPDPESAIRNAFNTVFSTLVVRIAHGPDFAVADTDQETFLDALATMTERYLFPHATQPSP